MQTLGFLFICGAIQIEPYPIEEGGKHGWRSIGVIFHESG